MFSSLDESELANVFAASKPRQLQRAMHINLARDFVGRVGLIWSGLFVTVVAMPRRRAVTLSRLKRGSAFAHMPQRYGAFFGEGHRLRCLRAGVILEFQAEVFWRLQQSIRSLADAMMMQVSLTAAEYAARVYEVTALTARERIQAELLRLARDGEWVGGISRISPRPTHQELADQVGVSREVATRCLAALAEEGLIMSEGSVLEVRDVERLLALDHAATGRRLFNPDDYVRDPQ